MRVLVAPDSFKGTLTAVEAAAIIAGALRAHDGRTVCRELPLADGGEGTLKALVSACGGAVRTAAVRTAAVRDPLGGSMDVSWAVLPGGEALVEAAACCGGSRDGSSAGQALRRTSAGLGDAIAAAARAGATTVTVALGGTGTNDAGFGMAAALDFRYLDAQGKDVTMIGVRDVVDALASVARILGPGDAPLPRCLSLADVDNPLCGPGGATHVFGPQKGVAREDRARLDEAIGNFARIVRRDVRDVDPDAPGSGAAGGLGFALAAFLGAELRPGAVEVLRRVRFAEELRRCDLVVTGEGRLDAQTARGKLVTHVAAAAREAGRPVVAVVGTLELDAAETAGLGLDAVVACRVEDGPDPTTRLRAAAERLAGDLAALVGRPG